MGNYASAREYLSRVLPWPEGGSPPYINVHWSFKRANMDKKAWSGRACTSVDEAIRNLEWAMSLPDTLDIYACMSSQSETKVTLGKNNREIRKAIRFEKYAVGFKSLFVDLDAKGSDKNSYSSMEELLVAFTGFLKQVGLPRPSVMVSTGGGMHVYWVTSRVMTMEEWQPLAHALVAAIEKFDLKCDKGCTTDAARILRIPDTFNRKTDTQRPVKFLGPRSEGDILVEKLQEILSPYVGLSRIKLPVSDVDPTLFPRLVPVKNDKLSSGINEYEERLVSIIDLAKACPFTLQAIKTGGKDYANPLWNLTTLMATFTTEGKKAAHIMARAHLGYTTESTDALYERKDADRVRKGLGWPGCSTIHINGSQPCKGCPHLAEGKTPFHFVKHSPVATVAATPPAPSGSVPPLVPGVPILHNNIDLPPGYTRDPTTGRILISWTDDSTGVILKKELSHYPMMQPWLQDNPHGLHFSTMTHKPAQIFILSEYIGSMEMRKILQGQGFMIHNDEAKDVGDFLVSWVQTLKQNRQAVVSTTPFGWNTKNGKLEGFVYGGSLYYPGGQRIAPSPDPVLAEQYAPTGTIEPWIIAAKLITGQERPDLCAAIASAFAAPLVHFTGHDGFLLSLWSGESGIGKTTSLKIAQAVWGDPVRALQGLSDTQNSVFGKIGELRSLPLYWDELKTDEDTRRFVDGVFRMTSGKEKSRMTSKATQRKVGTWQTLLVSASNESLVDFIASRTKMTTAGILRVFEAEVRVPTKGQISPGDAQRMVARLNNNFGIVGLRYAEFLGNNYDKIDKRVNDERAKLEKLTNASVDERFWCSLISALVVGAELANEIGVTEFNIGALRVWCIEIMEDMRRIRGSTPNDMSKTLNVSDILGQFLAAMSSRHTIKTNKIWNSQGKPPRGAILVKNTAAITYQDGIFVQIGMEDKIMRISSSALSKWCKEMEISRHLFVRSMEKKFTTKSIHGHLASGTSYAQPMGYLIEIDLTQHAELEEIASDN